MRFSKILLLAMTLLCIACGKDDDHPSGGSDKQIAYRNLKVMSFNALVTHTGDKGDERWSVRGPGCVKMIQTTKPDVIGLQECRYEQYSYLASSLNDYYAGVYIPEKYKNFGTCILYRKDVFNLDSSGYLWFSDNPTVPSPAWESICDDPTYRTYIWADLRYKTIGVPLRIYSTHFPRQYEKTNEEARYKCASAMVSHAKKEIGDDGIVFMTGDMNCAMSDAKGKYSLTPFTMWMKSARESLPSGKKDDWRSLNSMSADAPFSDGTKSIDHIFYRNVLPDAYRTVIDNYGVPFISDHYPILFDCRIEYEK